MILVFLGVSDDSDEFWLTRSRNIRGIPLPQKS